MKVLPIKKILAGVIGSLIILICINTFSYLEFKKLSNSTVWVDHTRKVHIALEDILSRLKDMETGGRGYVIAGKEYFLEPYYNQINIIDQKLTALKILTSDNPNQQKRLVMLEYLVKGKISHINNLLLARKSKGFASARQLFLTGKGKEIMDNIRKLIEEMQVEEGALLEQRIQKQTSATGTTIFIMISGSIFTFIVVTFGGFVIHRKVFHLKRSKQETIDREAKLHAILDTAVDAIITINEHRIIESFNKATMKCSGNSNSLN